MITIVDYGAGNLRSVMNTLEEIGAEFELVRDAGSVSRARKLVLPGVGHFGQMMRELDSLGLRAAILERIRSGIPFLGICLGLQALFMDSEEAPEADGFGVFPGTVRRFPATARVPHMGWNALDVSPQSRLLKGLGRDPYLYFAHSYYVPLHDYAAASCTYTLPYTAAIEHGNIFGVQFHPEKSGPLGLKAIRNFVEL